MYSTTSFRLLSVRLCRIAKPSISFYSAKTLNRCQINSFSKRRLHSSAPHFAKNHYETLGVSPTATQEEIKKAFRALAAANHPDKNKEKDPNKERIFREISAAYQVLSNEESRKAYDRFGQEGVDAQASGAYGGFGDFQEMDLADVFGSFFGGFGGRQRSDDIDIKVRVSFMEAVNGVEKEVSFSANTKCGTCAGSCAEPGTRPETCKTCRGRGRATSNTGPFSIESECRPCNGRGTIVKNPCKTCSGQGSVRKQKTERIKIPPGIDNGTTLRSVGRGNIKSSGQAGNLNILVEIEPHPTFHRIGNNIHVYVTLTLSQALLPNSFVKVPTLSGEVEVKVPNPLELGETRVLRGKGIRSLGTSTGDLHVHFEVQMPEKLTPEQIQALETLKSQEATPPPPSSQPKSKLLKDQLKQLEEQRGDSSSHGGFSFMKGFM